MGKIRKEYKEERVESYSYASPTSESSGSSGSSESSSSDSESGSSTERKRKHTRKKSKSRKEKKRRSESEEEVEYIEKEKKKRRKHAKNKDADEVSEDEEYIRVEERKHRSRKHKHHHRKHKHKHRRHRHHRSEEEYQERRRGASAERGDVRKEREEWEERKPMNDKNERDKRGDKESDRRLKKDDKRNKERGDNRQAKSKWDDDEDVQYNVNKRIKPDPDEEETRDAPRVKQERDRSKKRRGREEETENGRWGTAENDEAQNVKQENEPPVPEDVQKPTMALSGKLTEDSNTFNGVVIKYSQPPEARKPKRRWRWYIFKGEEDLPFLPLHRQSAYLIGRDRKVADIPTDHPSCSKQHAVLQYRLVSYPREDGTKGRTVKPYILDLESANGTYVNNRRVEGRRFVELIEKDVVKFGYSSREYILLHEGSKGEDADVPDMGVDMSPVSLLRS